MGNTIRRKPISFNIPSGPNYKFQNIVNFGGLEISDNTFNISLAVLLSTLNILSLISKPPKLTIFWNL